MSPGSPDTASLAVSLAPAPNGTRAKFTSDLLSADLITHRPRRSFNHPRDVADRLKRVERILRRKSFVGLPRLLLHSFSLLYFPIARTPLSLSHTRRRELLISVTRRRAPRKPARFQEVSFIPGLSTRKGSPRRDRERYRGMCCDARGCATIAGAVLRRREGRLHCFRPPH